MTVLSSRLDPIKPSATMAVTQKAQELRAKGIDIIAFSAGEPDFDTPAHIIAAAKDALDDGLTRYMPVAGMPALKQAVADSSKELRGVDCDASQVIIGVGAKHILFNFFLATLDPGDEVIIPAPYWVSYPDQVLLAGGTPVICETSEEENWVVTPEKLEAMATPKTKVLVLNTPSNPTGGVYTPAEVQALAKKAAELDIYVISDEIYRDLVYDGKTFSSPLGAEGANNDKIFIVDGVSKTYAMTGWRIGWGIGDAKIIKAMATIQGQSTSNATSFVQAASLAAIKAPMDFLPDWTAQYDARRKRMVEMLNAMNGVSCAMPYGAFYVFPNVSEAMAKLGPNTTDVEFATWLLDEAHVATVPGTPFGAPGHVRLSYATSLEQIETGLTRMADKINAL